MQYFYFILLNIVPNLLNLCSGVQVSSWLFTDLHKCIVGQYAGLLLFGTGRRFCYTAAVRPQSRGTTCFYSVKKSATARDDTTPRPSLAEDTKSYPVPYLCSGEKVSSWPCIFLSNRDPSSVVRCGATPLPAIWVNVDDVRSIAATQHSGNQGHSRTL